MGYVPLLTNFSQWLHHEFAFPHAWMWNDEFHRLDLTLPIEQ